VCAIALAVLALRWAPDGAGSKGPGPGYPREWELAAGVVALTSAALVEAFTYDVDNILLPLVSVLVFCALL